MLNPQYFNQIKKGDTVTTCFGSYRVQEDRGHLHSKKKLMKKNKKYKDYYTKQERARYNRMYKKNKPPSKLILFPPIPIVTYHPIIDLPDLSGETICCASWGCGKELSITEKLFGRYCINCQHINKQH